MVTWVSFRRGQRIILVRLESATKKTQVLTSEAPIATILEEIRDKPHIVVLDGFADGSEAERTLAGCRWWYSLAAAQIRKLIIVSSMGGISKLQLKTRLKNRSFHLPSWTLQEYVEAIQDDDLFKDVEKYLDAGNDPDVGNVPDAGIVPDVGTTSRERRRILLISKYFLGGGFCRGVFEMSSKDLIAYYRKAINSIDNPEAYVLGYVGGYSRQVLNRLVGSRLDDNGDPQSISISHFVTRELAIKVGPRLLGQFLLKFPDLCDNPSVQGYFFEAKFFSLIRVSGQGPIAQRSFQLPVPDGKNLYHLLASNS